LTGCGTGGSDVSVPASVEPARIRLKAYPTDFEVALARDFEALPSGSAGRTAIRDYGQLRRAVCAAEGYRQPVCIAIKGAP
jgi:hypothetical protein